MLLVISTTKPAEFVLTVLASHMHTTLILLNVSVALRARLCIQLYPDIIVIISTIDPVIPFGKKITGQGPVSFLNTLETPIVSAGAINISLLSSWIVRKVGAVWCWTPLHLLADVYERLLVVLSVLVVVFLIY